MAKATLEFDLNEQDDVTSHKRAVKSLDMALALWDISNLRKKSKSDLEYNKNNQSLSQFEVVDLVCDKIFEIFHNRKIDLDDLIE